MCLFRPFFVLTMAGIPVGVPVAAPVVEDPTAMLDACVPGALSHACVKCADSALTLVFVWVSCGCRLPAVFIKQNISLTEVMVRAQRVWGAPWWACGFRLTPPGIVASDQTGCEMRNKYVRGALACIVVVGTDGGSQVWRPAHNT